MSPIPILYVVLVTGDRAGYNMGTIARDMNDLQRIQKRNKNTEVLVICGGAPGVDTQCELAAKNCNLHTARVDALWPTRHQSAGPQRNTIMGTMAWLMEAKECLAYHSHFEESTGTRDMVKFCLRHGIKVKTRGFDIKDVRP